MILSIHQPSYFPWLGLLHKIANSDQYMVMDDVQLSDSAYQHRNLFLSADGKIKYLTIPINKKTYRKMALKDLQIADSNWRNDHRNFIENNYRKHPSFNEIFPFLDDYFAKDYLFLIDAVMASMQISLQLFGIKSEVILQSGFQYDEPLKRGELVVDLVKRSGATCYLSGSGAKGYLDESMFSHGLKLRYDEFTHPVYSQMNAKEFVPGLSCLDVLFNLGVRGAQSLIQIESSAP